MNKEFKNIILRLALGKAFEAGRERGVFEGNFVHDHPSMRPTLPVNSGPPDFSKWYRMEMKLTNVDDG